MKEVIYGNAYGLFIKMNLSTFLSNGNMYEKMIKLIRKVLGPNFDVLFSYFKIQQFYKT